MVLIFSSNSARMWISTFPYVLHFSPPLAGADEAAGRHGQRFRPSRRGSAAVHHLAAPHHALRGSAHLHGIHPVAHLYSHVLRRLRHNSQGRLPRWQRRAARHSLPEHLFRHRHRELGRRLRTQRQIRSLHPGVQVHQLDPGRHEEANAQREEWQEGEEAPRPHQEAVSVRRRISSRRSPLSRATHCSSYVIIDFMFETSTQSHFCHRHCHNLTFITDLKTLLKFLKLH